MGSIGLRLKLVRKFHNLNQKQFADAINISQGRLSEIEKGTCKPSADTLISIAEKFEVDLNWLLLESKKTSKTLSVYEIEILDVFNQLPKETQIEIIEYMKYRVGR